MKVRLGPAGGLGLVLAVFSIVVQSGRLSGFDRAVHATFERIWWQPTFPVFEAIAVLAGIELTSVASALLFLLLAWRRRWRDAAAMLAFPIALAVEALAKLVVNHPPPAVTHAGRLTVTAAVSAGFDSYPSGHVVRAVILFGLAAALVWILAPWPWVRRIAVPCAVALIVVIAFDRLYLSTHWATDVIGGLLLGGTALAAALAVRARPQPESSR